MYYVFYVKRLMSQVSKFKPLISNMDLKYVLGGGLELHFRVLFSAIFHGVSLGIFHQGRKLWK